LIGTVIALKVLVSVVLLASAPLALKRRWRLFLAVPLAVFQGFVPGIQVAGVPIPLAFLGGLMLWPEFVREFRNIVGWKPAAYLLGITVVYAVSLLWSSDRKLGLAPIGYLCQFLVIFAAVVTEGRRDTRAVLRLLMATVTFGLVQAATVVIFRLMPGLKFEYYLSSLSRWFISPNLVDALFTTSRNNVLSTSKSGGLALVDANDGSAYLGVLAFSAFGLALHLRKRWLGVASLMLVGAVAFSGSKAGLIFAVALPVISLHFVSLHYRRWRNRLRIAMVGLVLAGSLAWLGPKALQVGAGSSYRALDAFVSRSNSTLSVREEIWSYGLQAFLRRPFLGQGFGGWKQGFALYAYKIGIDPDLPPHNTYIYLWSQGGLLAAVLGLAFTFSVLGVGWRQMRDPQPQAMGLSLAMTMAFLWTFLHGMGNNSGLVGEMHMSPVLASLLALGYLMRRPLAATENNFQSVPGLRPLGDPVSARTF
jgi:O-antigen ligase